MKACQIHDLQLLNTPFLLTDTLTITSSGNFSVCTFTVFAVSESAGFTFTEALNFSKGIPLAGNGRN